MAIHISTVINIAIGCNQWLHSVGGADPICEMYEDINHC